MFSAGLDIRNLEAFIAVLDHGGFSAAAKTLRLTQSAVSLRVKSLEDALGTRLLERRGHTPETTPQGAALADHARSILDLVAATPVLIGGAISGQLTVGAVPTTLLGLLPSALADLRVAYPALQLTIRGGGSSVIANGLSVGASDVAIVTRPASLADGMRFEPIASEPMMALVPEHMAASADTDGINALLNEAPYIWFNRETWAGSQISAHLRRLDIQVNAVMEMDSLEGILSMVAAGLGVSVAPIAIAGLPVPANVRALPFDDGQLRRIVGVMHRERQPKMRLISALADALRKAARGRRDVVVLEG
jgi:DNA-binding transcriptional LysR family regulator